MAIAFGLPDFGSALQRADRNASDQNWREAQNLQNWNANQMQYDTNLQTQQGRIDATNAQNAFAVNDLANRRAIADARQAGEIAQGNSFSAMQEARQRAQQAADFYNRTARSETGTGIAMADTAEQQALQQLGAAQAQTAAQTPGFYQAQAGLNAQAALGGAALGNIDQANRQLSLRPVEADMFDNVSDDQTTQDLRGRGLISGNETVSTDANGNRIITDTGTGRSYSLRPFLEAIQNNANIVADAQAQLQAQKARGARGAKAEEQSVIDNAVQSIETGVTPQQQQAARRPTNPYQTAAPEGDQDFSQISAMTGQELTQQYGIDPEQVQGLMPQLQQQYPQVAQQARQSVIQDIVQNNLADGPRDQVNQVANQLYQRRITEEMKNRAMTILADRAGFTPRDYARMTAFSTAAQAQREAAQVRIDRQPNPVLKEALQKEQKAREAQQERQMRYDIWNARATSNAADIRTAVKGLKRGYSMKTVVEQARAGRLNALNDPMLGPTIKSVANTIGLPYPPKTNTDVNRLTTILNQAKRGQPLNIPLRTPIGDTGIN